LGFSIWSLHRGVLRFGTHHLAALIAGDKI